MATAPGESPKEEEVSFELGDRILLLGGRLDKLRGRIYYIDETLIRVLPDGVSDRLVEIPIVDGDFDPELGVEQLYSLSKRANPAFVSQIDARVDQTAETFGANGEPGLTYTIKAVNETEDKLLLVDETGGETEVEFEFRGIPLDLPFAVLRPRQPREEAAPGLSPEEEAMLSAEQVEQEEYNEFEDILEQEVAAAAASDVAEIYEIPASQRFYPDVVQRSDMLQDMIQALEPAAQKNPQTQKQVRALVEQCVALRNTLVAYTRAGEPAGQKQTSYTTLAEVIEGTPIPLSRPVIEAKRTLYLDHTLDSIIRMRQGFAPSDPREASPDQDVDIQYLDEVIKATIEYMKSQLGGISGGGGPTALPNWFLSWETLNKQYHSVWKPKTADDAKPFATDKEFLRAPMPEMETVAYYDGTERTEFTPVVDGLSKVGARNIFVTAESIRKLPLGLQRALGPRSTRLREKEDPRRVESAEEATIINTLLFPLSEQRNLGATRSGVLARDIALSHRPAESMREILERLEGIPETATAGGILSVGPDGNTQGNIPLEDWLRAQPLYPLGLADALVELASYGLSQTEFNTEQYDVLVERMDTYRALVKQYILETRDSAAKAISQLQVIENPFLTTEAYTDILETLQAEPILATRLEELRKRIPVYRENDIALFAGLFATSADLVLTTLAQVPGPLARERNRKVRDQFLEALRDAIARARKSEMAGEEPIPNRCEHVPGYIAVQKIKDDATRLQLFARYLAKFRGVRHDNWVDCNVCGQHLVCYHEVLLLEEFLHPREKDTLHKELLLGFSGGQFQGKYLCKNCGQGISDLEFDNNLEFSDEGVPLSGRAVLETDAEAAKAEELDEILGEPVGKHEETEYKTDTQTTIYRAARQIFDTLGLTGTDDSYRRIVQRAESEILKQPSRQDYQAATKGRAAMDYDILLNRILVCATAVNCLVEIQSNIPGYVLRYKIPGCRASISGYPLGNEKDRSGFEYIACAVATIKDKSPPWSLTAFQREGDIKKRVETITKVMNTMMTTLLTNAGAQQQLSAKRQYLENIYGSTMVAGQIAEAIPTGFLPAPFYTEEEDVKRSAIVANAAAPQEAIRAWILEAHRIGKESGGYTKDATFVEAICCTTPIQEPGAFWREKTDTMAALPRKEPPRGPSKGHIGIHYRARPLSRLEAAISPEIMYRIFLKVCYTGPRTGLPHAPGYTNTCAFCGFTFPESPYTPRPFPPMSSDSKTQKELMKTYQEEVDAIVTKGKVALETQKVEVNQRTFEELLDTTHTQYAVEPPKRKVPEAGMKLFETLRKLEPEPFDGWRDIITETMDRLAKLPPGADDVEITEAYGPMSNTAMAILESFGRIGAENVATLKTVLESGPEQATETIWTYVLLPLQRLITGFRIDSLRVGGNYDLGEDTMADIDNALRTHLNYLGPLAKRATGFTLHKMKWAKERLADALKLLKSSIRAAIIPGGGIGLPYLTTTLLGGILAEFINPNSVPPGGGEEAAAVDTGARAPIQILDVCVQRMRMEGLNYTADQIREKVHERTTKEKDYFKTKMNNMTPEEKAMEKMKKKLGLGDWAVGGTSAIYKYDPEQYERDKQQRAAMGFNEFAATDAVPNLPVQEEGNDVAQIQEDDY